MRDHFRDLVYSEKVKAVVITGAGKYFCPGRDVSEIIGPLTKMSMKGITCYYQNNWRFSLSYQKLSAASYCCSGRDLCRSRCNTCHGNRYQGVVSAFSVE